jgi:hypothetical protein
VTRALTIDDIRKAPKVLLHDHLDGGLRPQTVVELAQETGYDRLPTTDVGELGRWFTAGADRRSLELYLETFQHTVGVMQTKDALMRVAAECAEDLAADGIVYAEVRFAPELHVEEGLTLDEVVTSVLEGFRIGSAGRGIQIGTLCTAMRHAARSMEIAELAVRHRDAGVVGFDIAGAEAGFPPSRHLDAFSTSCARTSISPSTPARRSGCRPSGRRCSGAAPTGSGTASASSTTSTSRRTAGSSSAGSRPTSATAASHWRCARRPTCRPARPGPSPSTRSGCCAGCGSASRSTPTTG